MKKPTVQVLLLLAVVLFTNRAAALEFSLYKLQSGVAGPTLLVIGGIQGDEPGGFTAASLMVNNYSVSSGEVWIVPNLNFDSIIRHSRGIYGDMNRKFSRLPNNDPDYQAVSRIKAIIKNKQVGMILNLHDGSGFYNQKYIDEDENPRRWGQSIVIDQAIIEADRYSNIEAIAKRVVARVNRNAGDSKSRIRLKNTRTGEGDREMQKTLTFFAISNGKAAMGIEASKKYPTHIRALQLLGIIESVMDTLGIGYSRTFDLNAEAVKYKIGRDIQLGLYDKKIMLDLNDSRKAIANVPMKKNSPVAFTTNDPLVAVVKSGRNYRVMYGNRTVTTLRPRYLKFDDSLHKVVFEIDGKTRNVQLGTMVNVRKYFSVKPIQGHRVNVIGYKNAGHSNEAGFSIHRKDIMPRFSVDRQANKFRVEFYKTKKFSGMVLVNFGDGSDKLAEYDSDL
ncbi:MAG: M99 family carboxypeptidase catalytic domain-containing protein [Gammaproteobacteria bacterium]